jgi:hypothetical protein
MKHSDESIDKVLGGLRDAGPAVGMERRILEAVEKRASERSKTSWWQQSSKVFRLSPAKLLLCGSAFAIVVILLVTPKFYQHRDASPVSTKSLTPLIANVVRTSPTVPAMVERNERQPASAKYQTLHVQRVKTIRNQSPAQNTAADALALREMTAPSHPAPPLPLTAQEKLLVRVVHKGDPVELAMLNPEVRARQIADSQAEFQKFFVPDRSGEAQ